MHSFGIASSGLPRRINNREPARRRDSSRSRKLSKRKLNRLLEHLLGLANQGSSTYTGYSIDGGFLTRDEEDEDEEEDNEDRIRTPFTPPP